MRQHQAPTRPDQTDIAVSENQADRQTFAQGPRQHEGSAERHAEIAGEGKRQAVMAVPFVLAGTDLVATMAERIARRFADVAGVAILPLPYEVPAFAIDLVHGLRATSNPAMQWFVDLIVKTCRTI